MKRVKKKPMTSQEAIDMIISGIKANERKKGARKRRAERALRRRAKFKIV